MENLSDRVNNTLNIRSPVIENYSHNKKCAHCHRTANNIRKLMECSSCHAMVCEKCSVVNKIDHWNSNSNNNYSGGNDNANINTEINECLVCNRERISKERYCNNFIVNKNVRKSKNHHNIQKFTPQLEYKEKNDAENASIVESNEISSVNSNNSVTLEEDEMPSFRDDKERLLLEVGLKTRELSSVKEKLSERESKCQVLQDEINEQYEVIRQLGERLESVINSNETLRRELWSRAPQSRTEQRQEYMRHYKTSSSSPPVTMRNEATTITIHDTNLQEEKEECNTSHSASTIVLNESLLNKANEPVRNIQTQLTPKHTSIIAPLIMQIKPFTVISPIPEATFFCSSYCYDMKSCTSSLSGALLLPSIAYHMAREWNLFSSSSTSEQEMKCEESEEELPMIEENLQKTRETWQTKENEQRWVNYAALIEANYPHDNPHHNEIHAADVIQSVVALLTATPSLLRHMSALEKLCMVFAAMVHDVRHPGRSSHFLCKAHDPMYLHYNGLHVLEQMHIASSFELLQSSCHEVAVDESIPEGITVSKNGDRSKHTTSKDHNSREMHLMELAVNFTDGMTDDEFVNFHNLASYCILHTDMACHEADVQQWLGRIAAQTSSDALNLDFTNPSHRKEVLSLFLHAADVGVQSKSLTIAHKWLGIIDEMNAEQKELALLKENKFTAEIKECDMKCEECTDGLINSSNRCSNNYNYNNEQQQQSSTNITERDMKLIAPGQIQFLSECVVPLFYVIHHISSELTQPLQNLHQVILYYSQFVQGAVNCASFPKLPRRHAGVQTIETENTIHESLHPEHSEEQYWESSQKQFVWQTEPISSIHVLELLKEYAENKQSSELEKRLARVTVAMARREREVEEFVQEIDKIRRLVQRRERRNWQMSEYLWQIARKLLNTELYDEAALQTAYNSLELLQHHNNNNKEEHAHYNMKSSLQIQKKEKENLLYGDSDNNDVTHNTNNVSESSLVDSEMYTTLKHTQKRLHNAMSDMVYNN